MNKNTKKAWDTKQRIMKTLLDLLENNTLEEITITEICQYAQIGRPSFYRNFKSKEEVLEFIIVNKLDSMLHKVEKLEDLINDVELFYDMFNPEKVFFKYLGDRGLYLFIIRGISTYSYYRNYHINIRHVDIDSFISSVSKEYLYGLNIIAYLLMALLEVLIIDYNESKEEIITTLKQLNLSYTPSTKISKFKQPE